MKQILCFLLAILLSGCTAAPAETEPVLSGTLTLQCLEGAALVQCNGEALLVDCGENITAELLKNHGLEKLSAIVLTGCTKEETAGLAAVLEAFPTVVYAPGQVDGAEATVPENGQTVFLDCARMTLRIPEKEAEALALHVRFGEDSFLFLGNMDEENQNTLAENWQENTGVLHIRGTPAQALLTAAAPDYILVDGKAEEALEAQLEVFDTEDYGPVTVKTEGSGVTLSWSLHVSHAIATAAAG